ncbi:hypothetical protein XVE_2774 [Xanthomonas vesicatoria ATCC 35937]|uniref:Uncharacterized protein n=1 Tax=Xanthomonas vesicatoria ATCC 35937 TaxID=925775 RepID=F0BEZ4_9XANT|nr:hypothetical protein XVE_2774 [Xanthomonas vesicatoria ATCC 35937]
MRGRQLLQTWLGAMRVDKDIGSGCHQSRAADIGACFDHGVDNHRVHTDRVDKQAIGKIARRHGEPPLPGRRYRRLG